MRVPSPGHSVLAVTLALAMAACGATTPTDSPAVGPSNASALTITTADPGGFAFPYAAGTVATPGDLRLHDDNFHSLDSPATGSTKQGPVYMLNGAGKDPPGVPDASLDLLAAAGSPVVPLSGGTVLAAWPECQTVLVDHGGGV